LSSSITFKQFIGPAVRAYIPELARLRISIFREYPYCYDGNLDYEADYLAAYARSASSLFVLAFDQDNLVGASTGLPMTDAMADVQTPFIQHPYPLETVFYFGESILQPAYRGQGIGHRFFDARENYARQADETYSAYQYTCFCSVRRADDDPRRPPGYQSLDAFWGRRGYAKMPLLTTSMTWKEVNQPAESGHMMDFWLKDWNCHLS